MQSDAETSMETKLSRLSYMLPLLSSFPSMVVTRGRLHRFADNISFPENRQTRGQPAEVNPPHQVEVRRC
jgi:hypothetical protein